MSPDRSAFFVSVLISWVDETILYEVDFGFSTLYITSANLSIPNTITTVRVIAAIILFNSKY